MTNKTCPALSWWLQEIHSGASASRSAQNDKKRVDKKTPPSPFLAPVACQKGGLGGVREFQENNYLKLTSRVLTGGITVI